MKKEKNTANHRAPWLRQGFFLEICGGEIDSLELTVKSLRRSFDFEFLIILFGKQKSHEIAHKLAEFFGKHTQNYSIARYRNFKNCCIFIANSPEFEPGSFMACNNNIVQLTKKLEITINVWGEEQKILHEGRSVILSKMVNNVNACFKVLHDAELLPIFEKPTIQKKYYFENSRRNSRAELDVNRYDQSISVEDIKK